MEQEPSWQPADFLGKDRSILPIVRKVGATEQWWCARVELLIEKTECFGLPAALQRLWSMARGVGNRSTPLQSRCCGNGGST